MFNPKVSKPIGDLENQPVFLGWIIAVEKLAAPLKEQRVRKIVDITHSVLTGPGAKSIADSVIAVYQFQVIDHRQIQVQPSQLVADLHPPSLGPDISVVASIPAMDILALDLKVPSQVETGVGHRRGPGMLPRVIPFPRLARKAELQVVVRFERYKHPHASAAARIAVQIRHRIVRAQAYVPTQIQRGGTAGAICRAWPIHSPHGIVDQLALVIQRDSPA